MKKFLFTVLLALTTLFVSAQNNTIRFDAVKYKLKSDSEWQDYNIKFADPDANHVKWFAETTNYFEYYHIHLPELDIDFDGRVLKANKYCDADNDYVCEYTISNSKWSNTEYATIKVYFYKDGTDRCQIYIFTKDRTAAVKLIINYTWTELTRTPTRYKE